MSPWAKLSILRTTIKTLLQMTRATSMARKLKMCERSPQPQKARHLQDYTTLSSVAPTCLHQHPNQTQGPRPRCRRILLCQKSCINQSPQPKRLGHPLPLNLLCPSCYVLKTMCCRILTSQSPGSRIYLLQSKQIVKIGQITCCNCATSPWSTCTRSLLHLPSILYHSGVRRVCMHLRRIRRIFSNNGRISTSRWTPG
jgi:hypothetical protein